MSTPDVSVELIRSITENLRTHGKDNWESFSVIIDPDDDEDSPVSGTEGFLYTADAFLGPAGVSAFDIETAVWNYMRSYYPEGDVWPVRILVQYNRVTGQYNVLFEETDSTRWEMTPDTVEETREELRPTF